MNEIKNKLTSSSTFNKSFAGRSVLVTGHTGFKGSWLTVWLHLLGAKVHGLSSDIPTEPSNYGVSGVESLLEQHSIGDIRNYDTVIASVEQASPDIIFHLAAQPLVRPSYENPRETFGINVMGTCNLLEAVRCHAKPCVVVIVTSDKCYENLETLRPYSETDAMGGHDPYSASKGAAELVAASYRRSFFPPEQLESHGIKVATARAGNVIGGGDWAADRIVPDIVAHLSAGKPIPLRNPQAVRPWQHVLEPLSGYLQLAATMLGNNAPHFCDSWNFGPDNSGTATVAELVDNFCAVWGSGSWQYAGSPNQPHEAKLLRLSIEKAEAQLGWRPVWSLPTTIERTANWYRQQLTSLNSSMLNVCVEDIEAYSRDASHLQLQANNNLPAAA